MGDFLDTLGKVGKGIGKAVASSCESSLHSTALHSKNPEMRDYARNSEEALRNIRNGDLHFDFDDEE